MTRIYREGRKLLADFNVPEKVANWIRDGMLKFVSVELLRDVKADTREIPWVLDAVALLGADQPAVGILKSLTLAKARSAALQCRARAVFTRDNPTTGGHKANMAEQNDDLKAILQRLADAEKERDALKLKAAQTETFERELGELKTKTHNDRVTTHRASLMALFETPIKDKKILPATREQFKRVYKTDTDAVLDVTAADVDVFIRANPNPDAPRTPVTLNGVDPNAPEEKALMSVRAAVQAAASDPYNKDKPRDVLLVEQFKAQFRANPELAKAWQNAPGQIGAA